MRQILALSLLVLAVPPARAESVSEESFLAGLEADHVAVRALEEGVGLAEAARSRAGALANPRVEYWREAPDSNPSVTNWFVAWVPPLDGRYHLGKAAADMGLAAARERFDLDVAVLRREARGVFADWSLGHERLAVLRGQFDLVADLARQQRERAAVGEESGLAARRFMLAADEVRTSLRGAEAAYAVAEAMARAWRPGLPEGIAPEPLVLPEPPIVHASPAGPGVRALALDLEQTELVARRAGRYWGFPTLQLGWQTIAGGGSTHEGPIFGAGWTVPLDRDRATRLEAERRQEVASARLEWVKMRVAGEIEGRIESYDVLSRAARESRETLGDTGKIVEAVTASFRAGEADLTDLLETLRAALAGRLREIDARAQALAAHRELEEILGQSLTTGGTP